MDNYRGDVLFDIELPQVDHLQAECSGVSSPLFVHIVHIVHRSGIVREYVDHSMPDPVLEGMTNVDGSKLQHIDMEQGLLF